MTKGNVRCVRCGDTVFTRWVEIDDFGCDKIVTRPEKPFISVFAVGYMCEDCIRDIGCDPDKIRRASAECRGHAWGLLAE